MRFYKTKWKVHCKNKNLFWKMNTMGLFYSFCPVQQQGLTWNYQKSSRNKENSNNSYTSYEGIWPGSKTHMSPPSQYPITMHTKQPWNEGIEASIAELKNYKEHEFLVTHEGIRNKSYHDILTRSTHESLYSTINGFCTVEISSICITTNQYSYLKPKLVSWI